MVAPQAGQTISILTPHFSQNLTPSRLSNWHFGHFIATPTVEY
jgi:hypothetical protein